MPLSPERPALTVENRRKKPKSRNGCSRCKLKRLKCDETAPSCLQCQKRNVLCPGYRKKLKWSTKYEVFAQPVPSVRKQDTTKHLVVSENDAPYGRDLVREIEAVAAVLPKKEGDGKESSTSLDSDTSATVGRRPETPSQASTSISGAASTGLNGDDFDHSTIPDGEPPVPFTDIPLNSNSHTPHNFTDANHKLDYESEEEITVPADTDAYVETGSSVTSNFTMDDMQVSRLPSSIPTDTIEMSLIQHYFREVCVLFSSFDSLLNPFRTAIGRLYQESPSLYYAIQSMAAAHLANIRTHMDVVGRQMQQKASAHLQVELPLIQSGKKNGTATFLSIILLGMTTTWHESSALGEDFLFTARSLILPTLLGASGQETRKEARFFEESMIYWEMLMGFVTNDSTSFYPGAPVQSTSSMERAPIARDRFGMIIPHPWTGIAPTIQSLFAEVGRLVRRERLLHMGSVLDLSEVSESLLLAASLEEDLLAAEYPLAEELADPGDDRTAKRDFIVMAEAYRCTGLLELYRVFPPLLQKRLGTSTSTSTIPISESHTNAALTNTANTPHFEFETPHTTPDANLWISSLALHILSLLASLPSSSGTCCLQPILLVAAASELKLVTSLDFFDLYANEQRIRDARAFVSQRLEEYAVRLPAKPLRKTIELVREVWRRLDEGDEGQEERAFWIDVMVEKGWGTLMG